MTCMLQRFKVLQIKPKHYKNVCYRNVENGCVTSSVYKQYGQCHMLHAQRNNTAYNKVKQMLAHRLFSKYLVPFPSVHICRIRGAPYMPWALTDSSCQVGWLLVYTAEMISKFIVLCILDSQQIVTFPQNTLASLSCFSTVGFGFLLIFNLEGGVVGVFFCSAIFL